MEELDRVRFGERVRELPCSFRVHHPPQITNPETLWALSFWGFMEALWHWSDYLSHWPLAIDPNSSPSNLPEGGGRTESSNPLIKLFWWISQCLAVVQNITSLTQQKTSLCFPHFRNSKCFKSSVPEREMKTKIYISYYKLHYHSSCPVCHSLHYCKGSAQNLSLLRSL